jgi:uncharacterized membrane protein
MTFSVRQLSVRARLGCFALASILLLFALLVFLPPDGVERAEGAQFVGRFHPLAVHFPIALILLVPVLELAGRSRRFPDSRAAVDFVLALATLSAIVAATLGWCLARNGGYSGPRVTQHMWGGVSVAAVCWLCWMLRGRFSGRRLDFIYPLGLVVAVGLVPYTGYRGGQLSLGENHLTEFMPGGLRSLLGISAQEDNPSTSSNGGPGTFYGARVQPLFTSHCISCHGQDKHKSNLRLVTYDALMRGSKHGVVVKPGDAKGSELFRRITLPPNHDDFMPKDGKRPLSTDEVKVIELWISAGASGTQPVDAVRGAPTNAAATPVAADVSFEELDVAAVEKRRAPLAPAVAQLQKRFPDALEYESRGSVDLVLNLSLVGARFGDEDLAALKPISGQIVIADFSGTALTDRSAGSIAAMKRLRVLRLMRTKITDATMQSLGGLDQLESLNVFGTAVTPAALGVVVRLPKLRHLYAGETNIPADVAVSEAVRGKLTF